MTVRTEIGKRTAAPATIVAVFLRKSGLPREVLAGSSCPRPMARRRHELMWLLQRLTYLSLAQIGEVVGGLDPTTVRAGIDAVSDRMATDHELRQWLLETQADCLLEDRARLTVARRIVAADDTAAEMQGLAVTVVSVASVLASPDLTDAEARRAALALITREGASHG